MSLLLAQGHADAREYCVGMVWAESDIVQARINNLVASEGIVIQAAIGSALSTEGGERFTELIRDLEAR